MKLNKSTLVLGIAAALLAILSTSLRAQLFDYQDATSANPLQSGEAVLGLSTDPTWNNLSSSTLTDTTGTDTFTLTYSNPSNQDYAYNFGGNSTPNPSADSGTGALFASNLYNPGELKFTIGGLADDAAYVLVFYAGGSGTTPANYAITGTGSFSTYNSGGTVNLSSGNNVAYAEVNVVTSSTGTLAVDETAAAVAGSNGYVVLNGLQIEAAPEPSTWALLVLGGAVLLFVRNRRKTQAL